MCGGVGVLPPTQVDTMATAEKMISIFDRAQNATGKAQTRKVNSHRDPPHPCRRFLAASLPLLFISNFEKVSDENWTSEQVGLRPPNLCYDSDGAGRCELGTVYEAQCACAQCCSRLLLALLFSVVDEPYRSAHKAPPIR